MQLELGGHNPVIVRADADLDRAAAAVALGAFASAGQKCTATRRVYVHATRYPEFVERLVARAESLRVGYGLDVETEMGPLVNERALERSSPPSSRPRGRARCARAAAA